MPVARSFFFQTMQPPSYCDHLQSNIHLCEKEVVTGSQQEGGDKLN
jgi:hypothetical protein